MGIETALLIGGGLAVGMMASGMFNKPASGPTVETGGVKGVEAGIADSENRRRQVMTQLQRMRKATLLSSRREQEAPVKKMTLGPG